MDINKVIKAVGSGGMIVKNYFGQVLKVEEKSNSGDLRTRADVESEQAIIRILTAEFPNVNIYAEESGEIKNNSEYTFVIDPLDGTNNFVLGIPYFAVSVGLMKDDETVLGVIYNPILDQLFTAQKGKGACMNGIPIQVNRVSDITRSTVSYTHGYNTARKYSEDMVSRLRDIKVKRILDSWSPAYDYCLLAMGRIEAVINKEGDLEDYVAAKLIVKEAGGRTTSLQGEQIGARECNFIASNNTEIHNLLLV